MKQDMIVILDLGSTENTVLARAIRALGVYSEIYPHDITAAELKALPNVKGVIINGSHVHIPNYCRWLLATGLLLQNCPHLRKAPIKLSYRLLGGGSIQFGH